MNQQAEENVAATAVISSEIEELKHLLDGLNNRSAAVFHYINQDLHDYETLLMLRSEATDLRIAIQATSHCFGRLHKKYVSTIKDGEKSG